MENLPSTKCSRFARNEHKQVYSARKSQAASPLPRKKPHNFIQKLYLTKRDYMIPKANLSSQHQKQNFPAAPQTQAAGTKAPSHLQGRRGPRRALKHVSSALAISGVDTKLVLARMLSVRKIQICTKQHYRQFCTS